MGHYIRILGTNLANISLDQLRASAIPAVIEVTDGHDNDWQQLVLRHKSGQEIAVLEKNPVVDGELGSEELKEFLDEIPLYRPVSAALWLQRYLPTVRVIYAFQLLNGTDVEDGWTPLHQVYGVVWKRAGGILQADGEGFTNEEGYTILRQFRETVSGTWNMSVLTDTNQWQHFEMDLGNQQHREAFWRGEVPVGAKLL